MNHILTGPVEIDEAAVPTVVRDGSVNLPVLAAAYLQPGPGTESAHVVLYYNPDATVPPGNPLPFRGYSVEPDAREFSVGILRWSDSRDAWDVKHRGRYLVDGSYDLTYADALADFSARVARGY